MFTALFPFFILMSAGYFYRYIPQVPQPDVARKTLTSVTLWFFLPALVFRVIATSTPDRTYVFVPLIAGLGLVASLLLTYFIYNGLIKIMGRQARMHLLRPTLGVLLLGSAWGNITFLGLPLVTHFYGGTTARIAMTYDVFAITPLLYTLGSFIAATYGRTSAPSFLSTCKSLIKNPPLLAALAGILFSVSDLKLPPFLLNTLEIMGRAVTPVMVFSVGLALTLPKTKADWVALPWLLPATGVKLIAAPLIAHTLLYAFGQFVDMGFNPAQHKAMVLEAGMSSMVVTLVLADMYGLDTKTCARLIALTTALSFLTIPLFS